MIDHQKVKKNCNNKKKIKSQSCLHDYVGVRLLTTAESYLKINKLKLKKIIKNTDTPPNAD